MGKVKVVAFASPLHRGRVSVPSGVDAVVYSEDEASGINVGDSTPVLLILSGGVSRMIERFAAANKIKNAVLLSYPSNNSLASALSARSMLEGEGG
jgi:hypothetical protein